MSLKSPVNEVHTYLLMHYRNNLYRGMNKQVSMFKRIYNLVGYTTLITSFTDSSVLDKYIVKNYLVLDYKSKKVLVEIIMKSQSV